MAESEGVQIRRTTRVKTVPSRYKWHDYAAHTFKTIKTTKPTKRQTQGKSYKELRKEAIKLIMISDKAHEEILRLKTENARLHNDKAELEKMIIDRDETARAQAEEQVDNNARQQAAIEDLMLLVRDERCKTVEMRDQRDDLHYQLSRMFSDRVDSVVGRAESEPDYFEW